MGSKDSISEQIRQAREKSKLTQEEVAQKAGLNVSYYARLERGEVDNPTKKTLEAVAKVLKIKIQISAS